MQIGLLHELPFMDLYLRLDAPEQPRYSPWARGGDVPGNSAVPPEYAADIERLRRLLNDQLNYDDQTVTHDGVRFRVSRRRLANGSTWASLRRVADRVPNLDQLRIAPPLVPLLRSFGTRNGLVIVAGATGHGKTTTCYGLLADFLERYGNVAYTIEDPVEYLLQGPRGKSGYCFQVEVDDDREWASALKTALRWHPRYILVGEIRSPEAANQLLRAATSGHLVLTTMHAGGVEEALVSLIQLAESALGSRANMMLADGLVAVLHQTLEAHGPRIEFVYSESDIMGDPLRACVRGNTFNSIGTIVKRQEAQIFKGFQGRAAS